MEERDPQEEARQEAAHDDSHEATAEASPDNPTAEAATEATLASDTPPAAAQADAPPPAETEATPAATVQAEAPEAPEEAPPAAAQAEAPQASEASEAQTAEPETAASAPADAAPTPPQPETQGEKQDFGQILADFEASGAGERRADPEVGQKVSGRILSIGDETAFVDLGTKSEAAIAVTELRNKAGELTVAVGDKIDALVSGRDPESNCLVLKKKPGRGPEVGAEIRQAFEARLPVEGLVSAVNKGGLEVQVSGLRAFCPISQIESRFVEDASPYVGQRLSFRITRFEPASSGRRPNIVLSRRALLEEESQALAAETREKLVPGAVVRGKVTSLTTYGAFVDLGGLEGMLHVSEIGHSRVAHPKDALAVGQEIEVQVLKIEKGKDEKRQERISLSRKALERDPWRDASTRFTEGMEVDGRVVRLETFGAFVELQPGLDGLVHVSELGQGRRIQHPREAVEIGQDLRVRVLGVDPDRKRISLGLPGGSGGSAAGRQEGFRSEGSSRRESGGGGGGGREGGGGSGRRDSGGGGRGGGGGERREREPRRQEADMDYAGKASGAGFGSLGDFFKNDRKRR